MKKIKNKIHDNSYQLRMYSLVLYQLSGIQAAIQHSHSVVEYGETCLDKDLYKEWASKHKTVMVMNGGSSSVMRDLAEKLMEAQNNLVPFYEPDLYNQITSYSFIVSERVFDEEAYPVNLLSWNERETREILKKLKFHGGR